MDKHQQRIFDLEHELKRRDGRIAELKDEIDESRDLVRRMEEHAEEDREYLENFIMVFGLTLNDDGEWTNGEFIRAYGEACHRWEDLRLRYNKLVDRFNRNIAKVQPVGRPLAASEAQQAQIVKHHKAGKSARWIAEEMTLSRRTVTTVIDKLDGTDRTTNARRLRVGLEPKRKDWRVAEMKRLPERATAHFEKGRELAKEAKGLK
jgi:hypothetical protein